MIDMAKSHASVKKQFVSTLYVPPEAEEALALLEAKGYEAWLVGGWVRDALLNAGMGNDFTRDASFTDIDLCTDASPAVVQELFEAAGKTVIPTGLKHGTVTVLMKPTAHEGRQKGGEGRFPIEITTFRHDGTYSDARHPDSVTFVSSLAEDLSRRDFTINAMAYHPQKGLVDLFGGLADLKQKRIRAVGDPFERMAEDALRIVRALRFSCMLSFEIEPQTWAALMDERSLLKGVASERLGKEMQALMRSPYLSWMLTKYKDILFALIPEMEPLDGFAQETPYHDLDVLSHVARAINYVEIFAGAGLQGKAHKFQKGALRIPAFLGWAALLHDIGKPASCTCDAKTHQMHFYGHPGLGVLYARKILKRFSVPKETREKALALIRLHDRPIKRTPEDVAKLLEAAGEYCTKDARSLLYPLSVLREADALAKARAYRSGAKDAQDLYTFEHHLLFDKQIPLSPKELALRGDTLIKHASLLPGPEVGLVQKKLLRAVWQKRVNNDEEELLGILPDILFEINEEHLARLVFPGQSTARSLGLELERFVFEHKTQRRVTYETGLRALIEHWLQTDKSTHPLYETDACGREMLLGLSGTKQGLAYTLTLEPGSQLEVSLGPAKTAVELYTALLAIDEEFYRASHALRKNYVLVSAGVDATCDDALKVPLLQKRRYLLMDEYLCAHGCYARDMMRRSASTQISLDYVDFSKQYQLAVALSQFLYLFFKNSMSQNNESDRFSSLKNTPPLSRAQIWRHTDNARCGFAPATFSENFSVKTYLAWVESVDPIFFLTEDGKQIPSAGKTIGELMRQRLYSKEGLLHFLSMVFPDVRLKGFMEIRTADALAPQDAAGLAAFLKGIFYHAPSFEGAYRLLVASHTDEEIANIVPTLEEKGWEAFVLGKPVREIAKTLSELAIAGLSLPAEKTLVKNLSL